MGWDAPAHFAFVDPVCVSYVHWTNVAKFRYLCGLYVILYQCEVCINVQQEWATFYVQRAT